MDPCLQAEKQLDLFRETVFNGLGLLTFAGYTLTAATASFEVSAALLL